MSASVQRCLRRLGTGSYECLCPRAIITAWGRILRICTNALFLKDLYVAKLQSWARDNITTTTWPCFQAKQLFINTVCRYGQGFLEVAYLNGRYVYCTVSCKDILWSGKYSTKQTRILQNPKNAILSFAAHWKKNGSFNEQNIEGTRDISSFCD